MFTKRNLFIFLAGAAFFHTISHLLLPYYFALPLEVGGITVTSTFNNWVVALSAILTIGLLWGAKRAG
ncbi:MAG: hypothetical protein ACK4HV_05520 [Parachlamydiaceae bacterium]